ncbi:Type IIS restriction enzyme Eco57I [Pseudomonas savastanoi]|uniref:site-specific DNA-methyltransferase (adenine-specific) n=1 Tax=Pseudomonas savastanoi TaxID=29438 RepID=A0A3M5BC14_PSESS|nr:Type IIS restriction enzyme Eco57I [Pseudomonas savastanoi]
MIVSEMSPSGLFDVDRSHLSGAVEALASRGGLEELGAFYTRPEVVDFMLDLCGYTDNAPLHEYRVLEPSCGGGSFLIPVVERLLSAWSNVSTCPPTINDLQGAIRAVELHSATFAKTRAAVIEKLSAAGMGPSEASGLANLWMTQDDFLLCELEGSFDFVIGNPPYVRQELIQPILLSEYRRRYKTLYDRADLYVPFIERSLSLLSKKGSLTFICADRWMKNRYGGPLRNMVDKDFNLKYYIDMYDCPAFYSEVVAYPAITTIIREKSGPTRIYHRPNISVESLKLLSDALRAEKPSTGIKEITGVMSGVEPWLLESSDQMAIIRRLETIFPALEDTGCKVGIGVATGADKIFIGDYAALEVEPSRKLPLVTTKDIRSGTVNWTGQGVINPYRDEGGLVDLKNYPLLEKYLERHRDIILGRHCAQKNPAQWYKTIDRITPSIALKPKLLIPDIKGEAHIVYEEGRLYPHHNLYYITSDSWNLHALQAVLLSAVTRLFIATYSTKMRGGFLRFQAQYLRRIRLPIWAEISKEMKTQLIAAGISRDINKCNSAVFELYSLTNEEKSVLGGTN